MAPLDIYAGPGAMSVIKKEGFLPRHFKYFLGASGGPKWFVLAGLDRVLFPEWLRQRGTPLHIIGSSAGAFRAACAVQRDPLAAINRLADHYSHTEYSDKPTAREITGKARALIRHMLGEQGKLDLITNELFKAHFIVARCHGPVKSDNSLSQLTGLAMSAAANSLGRRHLRRFYTRCVFSAPHAKISIDDPYNIPTEYYELGHNSISTSLLASGSIPMVLQSVRHIIGAPETTYRDGGIVDYHFDVKFGPEPGLVLYPHFYPFAIPGWFDKHLKNRLPHYENYYNTVMLVPSSEFVANLPYGKIPDRKDFETMDAPTRIKYWQAVLSESDRLGDYFMSMAQQPSFIEHIKPLPFALHKPASVA
ncbi:patatin-like phospholipase family protein [Alteromonas sp. CYL-A6]|uniref:patatin-like phospholipase family protein n=1 Tax=Alteromonas nitratireducens TaxID=3390813 RepID=UPI0034AC38E1